MVQDLYSLIINDDEVTWQSIIYDLIKNKEIDAWDVDISDLTKKYIATLKKLKEADLRVSGKVLLAATMLLKIKSTKFIGDDLDHLDRLLASTEDTGGQYMDSLEDDSSFLENIDAQEDNSPGLFPLNPRLPQPRKRKVSIYDLVSALEQALEVNKRRFVNRIHDREAAQAPGKQVDISVLISNLYQRITAFFHKSKNESLTFTKILPDNCNRKEKVYTFLSLLHLTNQRKVELQQETHFGEIYINLRENNNNLEQPTEA